MIKPCAIVLPLVLAAPLLRADEGMWTYSDFPSAQVKARHGFGPDAAWLRRAQLASARLAGGCSASFVSPSGLVMTNHHCAAGCVQQLSTPAQDLVRDGFYAPTRPDERRCPDIEINQLLEIRDVTARVNQATSGLHAGAYNQAEKAELSRIERECATSERLRCDVVRLYHGGQYHLHRYRRFQDVRLVFAPEFAMAFFGGDPDNFEFPRYDLDVTFLRVYEDGGPAAQEHYFSFAARPAREGDLTFVSGNPGSTARLATVAQLAYQRDVAQPEALLRLAELRGVVSEFQRRGPEAERVSRGLLFAVENSLKAIRARHAALRDARFFGARVAAEEALRREVAALPEVQRRYGGAWDAVARAMDEQRRLRRPYQHLERHFTRAGDLCAIARALVRAAAELPKPSERRLRELRDSALPELRQALFSAAPIYPDLEILKLSFYLSKLREELGPDHPAVRKVLGQRSPDELAQEVVRGTGLGDVALRRRLWEGGAAAVAQAGDPLLRLAQVIDEDARAARQRYEDRVESVEKQSTEQIARARFAVEGRAGRRSYPDATLSLRLSYGAVRGFPDEDGRAVPAQTTFSGLYDRATGRPPFRLPERWLRARDRLDLGAPLNFCTDNDIIGGNSGSPALNRDGQIVGLVFDGNRFSLWGEYGFDGAQNRAVLVHGHGLLHALRVVYQAEPLLKELGR